MKSLSNTVQADSRRSWKIGRWGQKIVVVLYFFKSSLLFSIFVQQKKSGISSLV